jgi:hypothetical protein
MLVNDRTIEPEIVPFEHIAGLRHRQGQLTCLFEGH